jgi:hypothetical protein
MEGTYNNKTTGALLTIKETCQYLRCSAGTLAKIRGCGDIKEINLRGKILFSENAINDYITKNMGGKAYG